MENEPQCYFEEDDGNEYQESSPADPSLLSYIHGALSKSPVGSLLTIYTRASSVTDKVSPVSAQKMFSSSAPCNSASTNSVPSPSTTRRSGHSRSVSSSLADVKRVISNIAQHTHRSRSGSTASSNSFSEVPDKPHITRRRAHTVSSAVPTIAYVSESTPPLTPDSLSPASSQHSNGFLAELVDVAKVACSALGPSETPTRTRQESERIREGKRPQRDLPYDTLLAGISHDWDPASPHTPTKDTAHKPEDSEPDDDSDEWFGLEYTLELSRTSRHEVSFEDLSSGEFSKSPLSWAKMHRGSLHPSLEEQAFRRWLKWHNNLERLEERRRIERTFSFLRYSKRMAEIDTEMIALSDYVRMWQEELGYAANVQLAKGRLDYLARYRPDRNVCSFTLPLRRAKSLPGLRKVDVFLSNDS
ncbi:unnamed protein product [Somion occarium]|uniref:Uncharacterized protein n=1 Tax=Somion occarium TaxID=3059160 RepID=A0ABP1D0V0_9APHY